MDRSLTQQLCRSSAIKPSFSQRGQIVVEYVLLLAVAVSLALIIVTQLVKRGDPSEPENSGAIIRKWKGMQEQIGKDSPDNVTK